MASLFSFGFEGDDISESSDVNAGIHGLALGDGLQRRGWKKGVNKEEVDEKPMRYEPRQYTLEELLSTLPSQVSYNSLTITLSSNHESKFTLLRREIFDIRAQLMTEDDSESNENEEVVSGLENGDIKPAVYEGGFKTWECAIDLARLLIDEKDSFLSEITTDIQIIELGAGTAVPSLVLLQLLLIQPAPDEAPANKSHFIFADYNAIVLRLATLPNIILTWNSCRRDISSVPQGNLEINHEVLDAFCRDISRRGISMSFISGAWSPGFVDLALPETAVSHIRVKRPFILLILASETIYSPSSLLSFVKTLVSLLQRGSALSPQYEPIEGRPIKPPRSLIAAKRVYFGVGGGVDDFLATLEDTAGRVLAVKEKVDIENEGVGRVILEVRIPYI